MGMAQGNRQGVGRVGLGRAGQPQQLGDHMLDLDTAQKVIQLIDMLEDLDDVQNVYSNADIPDDVLAQME